MMKSGYKQAEVGIILEECDVATLSELIVRLRQAGAFVKCQSLFTEDTPLIRGEICVSILSASI